MAEVFRERPEAITDLNLPDEMVSKYHAGMLQERQEDMSARFDLLSSVVRVDRSIGDGLFFRPTISEEHLPILAGILKQAADALKTADPVMRYASLVDMTTFQISETLPDGGLDPDKPIEITGEFRRMIIAHRCLVGAFQRSSEPQKPYPLIIAGDILAQPPRETDSSEAEVLLTFSGVVNTVALIQQQRLDRKAGVGKPRHLLGFLVDGIEKIREIAEGRNEKEQLEMAALALSLLENLETSNDRWRLFQVLGNLNGFTSDRKKIPLGLQ